MGGDGKPWRIGTEVYGDRDILPRDVISRKLSVPNAERIFLIRHALRAGFTIEEIFNLTKIDAGFWCRSMRLWTSRKNWHNPTTKPMNRGRAYASQPRT
jgi:carbamoyl-phosphate synthase large subunit